MIQNYCNCVEDKFLVQTRSQIKASGVKLPAVHGTKNTLVPHEIPEKQPVVISRPRTRKGRAKVKRKVRLIPIGTSKLVETGPITNPITQSQGVTTMQRQLPYDPTGPDTRQTPPYMHPITRPPPRPPNLDDNNRRDFRPELITDPNIDFEENSPHQEGIISEMYKSPNKSYIKEPHELADLVHTSKMVQKFLPNKQI